MTAIAIPPEFIELSKAGKVRFIKVKKGQKEPLGKWSTAANYAHDDPELLKHLSTGGNYGYMVKGSLCVLDADIPEHLTPLIETLGDTLTIRSGREGEGYHILFECDDIGKDKILLYNGEQDIGDIRPGESIFYIVGPGSIHPSGKPYEIINHSPPGRPDPVALKSCLKKYEKKADTALIPKEEAPKENPADRINWKTAKKGAVKPTKKGKSLSDFLGLQMISILPPEMGEGSYRSGVEVVGSHPIHGSDGGHNWGINLQENRVYCHRHKSGTSDPLQVVALAIGKIDCEQLGRVKIEGELFNDCLTWLENNGYREGIEKWRESSKFEPPAPKILAPGGVNPEKEDVLVYLGTETAATWQKQTYFVNSPNKGIYLGEDKYREDGGPIIKTVNLAAYHVSKISQYDNPADPHDTSYTIILDATGWREKVTFSERSLENITGGLMKRPGIYDRRRLPDALSAIFGEFSRLDLIERTVKLPATGFYLDGKAIVWGETNAFPVALPAKVTSDDIRKGLSVLEGMMLFYGRVKEPEKLTLNNLKHVLPIIYWYLQAPLGFIRKQLGSENLYLLTHGSPHTGKTIAAKYGEAIWGIDLDKGIIGASSLTGPQLAQHFNKTTLPLCLDEVRNLLSEARIAEMIKNSSTGTLIKERIDHRAGYNTTEFKAYASLCLTANYVPTLYTGVRERLIPVEFTAENKYEDIDAVKKFEAFLYQNKKSLAFIGAGLREMFIDPTCQEAIKRDLLEYDPIKTGFKFLVALCKRHGIKPPAWMRENVIIDNNSDIEVGAVEALYGFLADSYLDSLRKISQSDYEVTDSGRYLKVSIPTSWEDRVKMLKERNLFPSHTRNFTNRGNLILRSSIIREIAEKTGYEIPGGVQTLVHLIGGDCKYYPDKGEKVLQLPLSGFIAHFREIDPDSTVETKLKTE